MEEFLSLILKELDVDLKHCYARVNIPEIYFNYFNTDRSGNGKIAGHYEFMIGVEKSILILHKNNFVSIRYQLDLSNPEADPVSWAQHVIKIYD